MKSADLIKELTEAGCELKRHNGGSHQIGWSPVTGKTFPVPHPKKDLPTGTVKSIKNGGDISPPYQEVNMFFSVGVETPKDENTAYGIIVPAFAAYDYGCFSAADSQSEIPARVREAILLTVEDMLLSGKFFVGQIKDAGYLAYSRAPEYADFDSWFVIDVDLSQLEGKQQRINIALPDTLINRIDRRVKDQPATYRDRSHFIAEAARHKLLMG